MQENIQLNPRKFVTPEYVYGVDSRLMAAAYCAKLGGRKIFVVTDAVIKNSRWFKELENDLQKHSLDYHVFSSVSPNPRDYEVMQGKNEYEEKRCNLILALGGGSVIDCAKGIGIVCTNQKHIHGYEGVDMINKPMPPLICIPSISISAVNSFAKISPLKLFCLKTSFVTMSISSQENCYNILPIRFKNIISVFSLLTKFSKPFEFSFNMISIQ